MKQYNFHNKLKDSKDGTAKIIQYLKDQGRNVCDAQDIKEFFEHDIDIVIKENNSYETIEVKVDTYTTNNFALELLSNVERKTLGCIMKTKSKFLYYYFINQGKAYIFNTKKLQSWVTAYKDNFRRFETSTNDSNGNILYHSSGILVPIIRLIQDVEPEILDIK